MANLVVGAPMRLLLFFPLLLTLLHHLPATPIAGSAPADPTTSVAFIRTSCGKTTYPDLCVKSLSTYATAVQTSPAHLADVALDVSLRGAQATRDAITRLGGLGGAGSSSIHLKPREAAAMRDCVESMGDSIGELRRAMARMADLSPGSKDLQLRIDDVQTWVSAALTEEDTCMDGFAGKDMDGPAKAEVRARIKQVAQLTSNALALVNALAVLSGSATTP